MRNINSKSWLDARLEVRSSLIQGNGIFAREKIKQGEIVMVWGGKLFTREEIQAGKAKSRSVSGFSEGWYLGLPIDDPDVPDQCLNHSCDPNVWMVDEVTLVSRIEIARDEELTADYAMWELDSEWKLEAVCNCGNPCCRGVITGNDWRAEDLQNRYKGHFLPCINERISMLDRDALFSTTPAELTLKALLATST